MSKGGTRNSLAPVGMRYCDWLFEHEHEFADLSPKKRQQVRTKTCKSVLKPFLACAKSCNTFASPRLERPVYYAQSDENICSYTFLDDRLKISNNQAKRSIKPFVIGRKKFFANAPKGTKASAILYSLLETAKKNCVDPCDYLTQAFCLTPNGRMDDPAFVDNLLPAAF